MEYCLRLPNTPNTHDLKTFSVKLFEIIAHAAGVESLFSGMSAQKTKSRPRMDVTTLKIMSHIDMNLQSENPKRSSKSSSKDHTVNKPDDDLPNQDVQFEDIDQLQEFEDGVHFDHDEDPKDFQLDELEYMDTLFDISLYKNEKDLGEGDAIMVNVSDPEDEDWNEEDLFS